MFQIKPFWKSKTFWANTVVVAAIVVSTITGADVNVSGADVDPETQTAVLAIANIILRFFSTGPVTLR